MSADQLNALNRRYRRAYGRWTITPLPTQQPIKEPSPILTGALFLLCLFMVDYLVWWRSFGGEYG